ncbi:MAG: class I SAM-dependent methyltransferase, partial [Planctomycetota bacterium]
RKLLPGDATSLLDLGCGEGFVGDALRARGYDVTLADAADFHRSPLPFVLYDGRALPFADRTFDAAYLYFVLHHTEDARAVLDEALRVARRVIVVESVYRTPLEHRWLDRLDRLANRLRSGLMKSQEEHLHFRTASAWVAVCDDLGAHVITRREHGRPPHRQATFVVERRS